MDIHALIEEFGGQASLAKELGITRQEVHHYVKGRPISAPLAIRIFNKWGYRVGPLSEPLESQREAS